MSVYSMTGYASASVGAALRADGTPGAAASRPAVNAEVRSVNGRFLDLSLKLPDEWRALEPALRELVAASVKRGKVELRLAPTRDSGAELPMPGPESLLRLARTEAMVQGWLPKAAGLTVHEALQWCRENQVTTVAVIGAKNGKMGQFADHLIVVGDTHYGRVEDAQMTIYHMLCYAFMELPAMRVKQGAVS